MKYDPPVFHILVNGITTICNTNCCTWCGTALILSSLSLR